jgi:hypothetical protein
MPRKYVLRSKVARLGALLGQIERLEKANAKRNLKIGDLRCAAQRLMNEIEREKEVKP